MRTLLLSISALVLGAAAPAQSSAPTAAAIVAQWRSAMHADAAPLDRAAYWRASVSEDGLTHAEETWVDRSGRFANSDNSPFSADAEVLSASFALRRDWDGFVRDLEGDELRRLRTRAFNAATLTFGPNAAFTRALVGESDDHNAWTLTLTPANGAPTTWAIDKQSGLPRSSASTDGDGNTVIVAYTQWTGAGGVQRPTRFQSRGSDNGGADASVSSAGYEPPAAATFARLIAGPSDVAMASDEVRLPFRNEASHIVLQIQVNGHAPIGFIFDTGDDTETLSTPRLAEMGVTAYGASQLVGGGNAATSSFARDLTLSMGGVELRGQHATVLDLSGLERALGTPIGGILGYDFISRFVVEIDYQTDVMTLHPRGWRYDGRGAVVPISLDNGIPRADVILSVPTKPLLPAHMIVDFGAADTMTLTSPFVAANDLRRLAGTNRTVFGASGLENQFFAQHNTRGHIDALHLGALTLRAIPVSFSTNTSGAYASASFAGTIGNGVYSRFRAVLDYGRNQLILAPTPHSEDPFPERRSFGLTLIAGGADLHVYTAASVRGGSPAEAAGFRQNDVIAGVDDRPASAFTLSDLRDMLSRDGVHHVFHVLRGEQRSDIDATVTTASIEH
jgi:hypothetical protein